MKRFLLFLIFCILISCKEKFNPNEFKGTWISFDEKENFKSLPTITFQNNSIYLEDIYTYAIKGKYQIKRNSISYFFKNDTINSDFSFNRKDSVITIGKNKYSFWEGYSFGSNFIEYELISINRKAKTSADSLTKLDCAIHIFKDANDSLKLKLNDKIVSDFNVIPSFVIMADKFDYTYPGIYIGRNISLKELLDIYIRLWSVNIKNSMLVLKYNLNDNFYSTYLDYYDFWDIQIKEYYRNKSEKIEPISTKTLSRKQYVKKYNPKFIKINSKKDFKKLAIIKKENNYLIQINTRLNLETYISLKEKISEIKKKETIRIKIEFNLFPPPQ